MSINNELGENPAQRRKVKRKLKKENDNMRSATNELKFVLKGKIDSIEDDMTINVIGGTSKNPIPDSDNLQDIAEKLFAFYKSLDVEDDTELIVTLRKIEK